MDTTPQEDSSAAEKIKMASMSRFDPLNNLGDDNKQNSEPELKFDANDTIITNDDSEVGGYSKVTRQHTDEEPLNIPELPLEDIKVSGGQKAEKAQPDTVADAPQADPISPEKMDFIKTYTKEYDDTVAGTTHAVEMILDSIDKTVKSHADSIAIPEEAITYISDNKPTDGKVSKYEEAQEIVRSIMTLAESTKKQSEQAAQEASQIYDSIQQFRHDTEAEIKDIRSRDEFGNVVK